MNDSGHVSEERQHQVQPEVKPQSDLEKYADRRQEYGEEDADEIFALFFHNDFQKGSWLCSK